MDKQRNQPTSQEPANQKRRHRQAFSHQEKSSFTDKERKREEIKQSTIGGF